MAPTSGLNTTEAPRQPSPLWIIALFIALSELTAAIAAVATDGTTRLIFAVFAVLFPLVVLAVFIWLLIKHPANLYSPSQYTDNVGVQGYAAALSRQYRTTSLVYGQAVSEAIISAGGKGGPIDRGEAVRTFERLVEDKSITVDRAAFVSDAEPAQIPVGPETTVDEFLDAVFFEITPSVRPFTYGISWGLATQDHKLLSKMGTRWAKGKGLLRDERSLREVGLEPGGKLWAVDLAGEGGSEADAPEGE
jgi:hypothetical protein